MEEIHVLKIDTELQRLVPNICCRILEATVNVRPSEDTLIQMLQTRAANIAENFLLEDIARLQPIAATRRMYRTCGKDPSRYRPAAESLLRRIIKGQKLYFVNNVVDVNNLISLESYYSIGVYDADKISGEIHFGIGSNEMDYWGIGRGSLNVAGLPLFYDDLGPFASPTSDSERTRITPETSRIWLNIIGFSGNADYIQRTVSRTGTLLKAYCI